MQKILKRLRLKFMLTIAGIVAILVIAIATGFCLTTYNSAFNEINGSLEREVNASIGISPQGDTLHKDDTVKDTSSVNTLKPPKNEDDHPPLSDEDIENSDQRINLYHGRAALVYTVVVDSEGTILRNDSPALVLDDSILESAIEAILDTENFSFEEGVITSGKLNDLSLFYRTHVHEGNIAIGLTDSTSFDERMTETVLLAVGLVLLSLTLIIVISFFLARLFMRPVEDAWNKQRRFIADASHELKTPLTVIMANTEIIQSSPDETVQVNSKWLEGIQYESKRMQELIADLLLLARMDDEAIQKDLSTDEIVSFSEIVEDAIMSFEAVAFERKLTIKESIAPELFVKGSSLRLSRLPDILLDNACKYCEEQGTIEVTLSKKADHLVLRVFNTGQEIEPEELSHLFDRFYRVDQSRSADIPGYGLGLSIAQSIVEEHGGSIVAENSAGEGVAFIATLPAHKSH